jgi:hypothetical protein
MAGGEWRVDPFEQGNTGTVDYSLRSLCHGVNASLVPGDDFGGSVCGAGRIPHEIEAIENV